jgi:Tol biopolymer transport system component
LFVLDLRRGTESRLTFDPTFDTGPVWSPDGLYVAFASNRRGVYDIYKKLSTGAGTDTLLLHTEDNKYLTDWSRDGRYILYVETNAQTREDIWVLDLESGAARPYLKTEFREMTARFSPDSRWIAYSSDETAKFQVYVQSFPSGSTKLQVSAEGGDRITWRADGKELYYVSNDLKLMAVDATTSPRFAPGLRKRYSIHPSATHT